MNKIALKNIQYIINDEFFNIKFQNDQQVKQEFMSWILFLMSKNKMNTMKFAEKLKLNHGSLSVYYFSKKGLSRPIRINRVEQFIHVFNYDAYIMVDDKKILCNNLEISKFLKNIRKIQGINVPDMANKLNCSRQAVYNYEGDGQDKHHFTPSLLNRLFKIYGCSDNLYFVFIKK